MCKRGSRSVQKSLWTIMKPALLPNICTTDTLVSMGECFTMWISAKMKPYIQGHSECFLHQRNSEEFHTCTPIPSSQTEEVRDLHFLSFHDRCSPICTSALRAWRLMFLKSFLYRLVQKLTIS